MSFLTKRKNEKNAEIASTTEQEDIQETTTQVNDKELLLETRRKIAEARKKLYDAKTQLSLKDLEMMKQYTFYFDPRAQDFEVKVQTGEHGDYGALTLKFIDMTKDETQTEFKELFVIGDYYIDKLLGAIEKGEFLLNIKKTEWKGQGNRKFDLEVLKA